MQFNKPKARKSIISLLLISSILVAYLLGEASLFQSFELKLLDLRFQMRGRLPLNKSPVVILAIDNQSDLSTPARWPWPRSYFAHVVENLEKAGVAAIGIDVIFDQPDRYNPRFDDSLAHTLSRYDNIVLAGKIRQTSGRYSTMEILPPYEKFLRPSTHWGLVTLEADIDGFYRRYPFLVQFKDTLLGSFAAEILNVYEKEKDDEKAFRFKEDKDCFWAGHIRIPKYDAHSMLINYFGPPYSFSYYSFDNVLDDQEVDLVDEYDIDAFDDPGDSSLGIPPGLLYSGKLKDKIVLIGSTMSELHDNFPTPFLVQQADSGQEARIEMPGVEVHANALQTVLDRNFIRAIPSWMMLFINIVLALFLLFFIKRLHTMLSLVAMVVLIFVYFGINFLLFAHNNVLVPVVMPTLVIFLTFISQTSYDYWLTQREKKMLRGVFAHYVPEKVIQEIIDHPEKLSLGGEERIVTVLFSDVAGFTTLSEKMSPKELVALLNEYLTAMTDIILKHDGIIDKFEGDAIMAEFGVPVFYESHAKDACSAALEMQTKLKELRHKWRKEGKPELHARIGINTGEMIVGNMGSNTVFDYTVIGDHVNLGSRLEGANKAYQTNIMVSGFTHEAVKDDFVFRALDLIRVKGKEKPVQVYELIGTLDTRFTDQFLEMLDTFNQGLIAYRLREWENAFKAFKRCLYLVPNDRPSQIYVERCLYFKENPPADNWDGVWELREK